MRRAATGWSGRKRKDIEGRAAREALLRMTRNLNKTTVFLQVARNKLSCDQGSII
jgi:hypothetical protein